ncbi:hypothetical protein AB0D59_08090 [Streptomyces sp. NPDC048417]|uniref:hypothetical protein n=1 Tax=Streptomyces sp. NPDC048417 TaxID=3155387 RepID=UPI0034228593
MRDAFRDLSADGVASGLWLQAYTPSRKDEELAAHCRSLVAGVPAEAERLTGAGRDELARLLANGALVVLLRSLGADLTGGSWAAVAQLHAQEVRPLRTTRPIMAW